MAQFNQLWINGPVFSAGNHFALSTDSILLASFVCLSGNSKVIDLGCSSGILSLLLLDKYKSVSLTGLELNHDAAELANENIKANALNNRCTVTEGDIRNCREFFQPGSFDAVVANPPYFAVGTGALSAAPERASARGETDCSLDDICAAAKYLCRSGGKVFLVYKPERMSELFCTMAKYSVEPKRLRLVCNKYDSAPSLVLVEGRRDGGHGLKIEPMLFLHGENGEETDELKKIYHR